MVFYEPRFSMVLDMESKSPEKNFSFIQKKIKFRQLVFSMRSKIRHLRPSFVFCVVFDVVFKTPYAPYIKLKWYVRWISVGQPAPCLESSCFMEFHLSKSAAVFQFTSHAKVDQKITFAEKPSPHQICTRN